MRGGVAAARTLKSEGCLSAALEVLTWHPLQLTWHPVPAAAIVFVTLVSYIPITIYLTGGCHRPPLQCNLLSDQRDLNQPATRCRLPFTCSAEWRGAFRRDLNKLDNAKGAKATDALLNYETVKYGFPILMLLWSPPPVQPCPCVHLRHQGAAKQRGGDRVLSGPAGTSPTRSLSMRTLQMPSAATRRCEASGAVTCGRMPGWFF